MPKQRSPNREKAFEIYKQHNGNIDLVEIAKILDVSAGTIRGWKNKDHWDEICKGTFQKNSKKNTERSKRKKGGQIGNKNSVGHVSSVPKKNKNAETHGFFSKYLPEETLELMDEVNIKSPLDILWDNITIQYAAIIRAQKIMFVTEKEEMIKELKKSKVKSSKRKTEKTSTNSNEEEYEYEFQFSWDRHATFLQAQSRAMATLQSMIRQYDELLKTGLATEEQKLRIEKLKMEVDSAKELLKGPKETEDDGFIEALKGEVAEVWADEDTD